MSKRRNKIKQPAISDAQLEALKADLGDTLVNLVQQRLMGADPLKQTAANPLQDTASERTAPDDRNPWKHLMGGYYDDEKTQYERFMQHVGGGGPMDRRSYYKAAFLAELQHPEIARGLDIYADYTASGSAVERRSMSGSDAFQMKAIEAGLQDETDRVLKQTKLQENTWDITRRTTHLGDDFIELAYDLTGLTRLRRLPTWLMYRIEKEDGLLDPEQPYVMRDPEYRDSNGVAQEHVFKPWQVVHYRMAPPIQSGYGTGLLTSLITTCNEINLMEAALTIARLTKAHRRLIYTVDVGNLTGAKAEQALLEQKNKHKKRRRVDPATGRILMDRNPLLEEEDIWVGKGADGGISGVSQLPGDPSIARITDLEHKYSRLFAGMRASQAWFGKTGPNIRNVMNEQVLAFMRACRRIRGYIETGHMQVVTLGLIAMGISPEYLRERSVQMIWPAMTHADDEAYIQLQLLKAQVAQIHKTVGTLPDEEILSSIMGYGPEEVRQLMIKLQGQKQKDLAFSKLQQDTLGAVPTGPEAPPSALAKRPEEAEMHRMMNTLVSQFSGQLSELQESLDLVLSGGNQMTSHQFAIPLGAVR